MITAPPTFRGEFETHVTVRADSPATLDAFERFAGARDLKFTHIRLARGRVCDQPMLTAGFSGAYAEVRASVDRLVADVVAAGFPVVRTKIEATPWAEGVPADDEQARALGPGYYFEHHVKLLLPAGTDGDALAAVAAAHAAHLSANARRTRADGGAERFVTQRCRLVGDADAAARARELLVDLELRGYEILSVEREFVVHDSDESVDAGWIDERRESLTADVRGAVL
ncbi:hypothetical protein ABZ319_24625 [Nocardia sp. NPDC005978]|uniref:hypothetical protein n=1 Tax=Nocardia sp. NPDC005978 TaxID=3156725 RepID=UPI0033B9FEC4